MNKFYQPLNKSQGICSQQTFLTYLLVNHFFFSKFWLSQFSPCSALAGLWPGQKLAVIIVKLEDLQTNGVDCESLLLKYKKIYRQLTMTDFPSHYYDKYIQSSTAAKDGDGVGSFMSSTFGNATGRQTKINQ